MNREPQKTEVEVFKVSEYDSAWPLTSSGNSLPIFIGLMQNKLLLVPEEHRSTAKIHLDVDPGWEDGDERCVMTITYERMETQSECEERVAKLVEQENSVREKELRELNRLRKKYETQKPLAENEFELRVKDDQN